MVARWLDSQTPSVRWIIFSGMVGMMLLWPAYRLSGDPAPPPPASPNALPPSRLGPVATTLIEWLCLMLVFQIVLWPIRLAPPASWLTSSTWSVQQTAWLDGAIACWTLMSAAVVAIGARGSSPRHRTLAMCACIFLFLGEPVLVAGSAMFRDPATRPPSWNLWLSPIQTIWEMCDAPANWSLRNLRPHVVFAASVTAVLWLGVAIGSTRKGTEGLRD
jgi:hypothetical protein